jgi:hypothetical protein
VNIDKYLEVSRYRLGDADKSGGTVIRSKALNAAVVVGVTPMMLSLAPGTAQAEHIACPGDASCPYVSWDPSPGVGLTVRVRNDKYSGAWNCNYTATPAFNPLNLPPYQHQFHLAASTNEASWPITNFGGMPAVASGTEWNIVIDCTSPENTDETMTVTTTKVF